MRGNSITFPLARNPDSVRNVNPFINLESLIPSAFIMATDLSVQPTDRHNHIGLIAVNPSAIISNHELNEGLATVMDLGDGVIGEMRTRIRMRQEHEQTIANGPLAELIPVSTLNFLGFSYDSHMYNYNRKYNYRLDYNYKYAYVYIFITDRIRYSSDLKTLAHHNNVIVLGSYI